MKRWKEKQTYVCSQCGQKRNKTKHYVKILGLTFLCSEQIICGCRQTPPDIKIWGIF